MTPIPTFGGLSANPAHRSFFRDRLQRVAGQRPLDDWLVEEANVRGHVGAVGKTVPDRAPTSGLSDEDLVIALLMPQTPADGRLLKLVVRLLQRAPIQVSALWFRARRERADRVLYWLLQQVPPSERIGSIGGLLEHCPVPPRGYQGLHFNYDASRLLRRPATRESVWKAAQR